MKLGEKKVNKESISKRPSLLRLKDRAVNLHPLSPAVFLPIS